MNESEQPLPAPSHGPARSVPIKSGEQLGIRPATVADVPLVAAMIRELAEYEKLLHEVIATEQDLHDSLFGSGTRAEALIADVSNSPVAFALYFHNFSTFAGRRGLYIEDLYVRPDWRGRGIGKALLSHLAGLACDRGCARMEWTVLDWNQPAIDVYRSIGAVGMDQWRIQRLAGDALRTLAQRD